MRKVIKTFTIFFASLLLMSALVLVLFWSPDLEKSAITEKYSYKDSLFLALNADNQIHYRDIGNKSAPTLVLIHGTSSSLHTWEPIADKLKENFRLVMLDLPGHGLTGASTDRDYSRRAFVKSILSVLDHLNIASATLVGNSLGGAVSWQAALEASDRVDSLILLAPAGAKRNQPSKSNIGFKILANGLGQRLLKKITPRFIIERSLIQTVKDKNLVTDKMVTRYWELLKMKGNRQAMIDLVKSKQDSGNLALSEPLSTPALIIWGQNDELLPVDMIRQFEKVLIDNQSHILPNIGHLPQEEAVDTVAELILTFCQHNQC